MYTLPVDERMCRIHSQVHSLCDIAFHCSYICNGKDYKCHTLHYSHIISNYIHTSEAVKGLICLFFVFFLNHYTPVNQANWCNMTFTVDNLFPSHSCIGRPKSSRTRVPSLIGGWLTIWAIAIPHVISCQGVFVELYNMKMTTFTALYFPLFICMVCSYFISGSNMKY